MLKHTRVTITVSSDQNVSSNLSNIKQTIRFPLCGRSFCARKIKQTPPTHPTPRSFVFCCWQLAEIQQKGIQSLSSQMFEEIRDTKLVLISLLCERYQSVINRRGEGVLQKQKARQPARYLINQPASQSGKSVEADQLYQVHKVVKKKKKNK